MSTGRKTQGLGRPTRSKVKTKPPSQKTDKLYREIWLLVDGATRDAFNCHPEYLAEGMRRNAVGSIVKRVTGAITSFTASREGPKG